MSLAPVALQTSGPALSLSEEKILEVKVTFDAFGAADLEGYLNLYPGISGSFESGLTQSGDIP